jgi:suppressor of fused
VSAWFPAHIGTRGRVEVCRRPPTGTSGAVGDTGGGQEVPGQAAYEAWRAEVREAVAALAPRRLPTGFTPKVPWVDGGEDPIDEVFAVAVDVPLAHWAFVGAGLVGFGFELVLRLRRDPTATEPPEWPVEVLQNLGRYVCSTGNVLRPRDWMPLHKPMTWAVPTELTGLVFTSDPDLADRRHEGRTIRFVQVVGVTEDELEAIRAWDVDRTLDLWRGRMPHLVVDPGRRSLMADPDIAAAMAEGARTEGSGSSASWVSRLGWAIGDDGATVSIAPGEVGEVVRAFRGRLPFGKELLVGGGDRSVLFRPAREPSIEPDEQRLTIGLPPAAVDELVAALQPGGGTIRPQAVPGLVIELG